jgi:NADH:ubiquinone oxidoreductase subunit
MTWLQRCYTNREYEKAEALVFTGGPGPLQASWWLYLLLWPMPFVHCKLWWVPGKNLHLPPSWECMIYSTEKNKCGLKSCLCHLIAERMGLTKGLNLSFSIYKMGHQSTNYPRNFVETRSQWWESKGPQEWHGDMHFSLSSLPASDAHTVYILHRAITITENDTIPPASTTALNENQFPP